MCTVNYTTVRAWAHQGYAYAQLSSLYLLSTLYITHVIPGPPPLFVLQAMEGGLMQSILKVGLC